MPIPKPTKRVGSPASPLPLADALGAVKKNEAQPSEVTPPVCHHSQMLFYIGPVSHTPRAWWVVDSNADRNAAGLGRSGAGVSEIETDAHGRLRMQFLKFITRGAPRWPLPKWAHPPRVARYCHRQALRYCVALASVHTPSGDTERWSDAHPGVEGVVAEVSRNDVDRSFRGWSAIDRRSRRALPPFSRHGNRAVGHARFTSPSHGTY